MLSHRIYTLILRILHNRLVAAAELNSHSLLLECYPPSAKLTEPPYFCAYHGTDGLSYYETPRETDTNNVERLGEMRNMYSRFRPYRRELESGGRRVRPGDVPGSRTFPGTVQDKYKGDTVRQTLSLEAHELFAQLVAQANLAKIGTRSGLFTAFVDVEEGVLRVWRNWLSKMARRNAKQSTNVQQEVAEVMGKGKQPVEGTVSEKADLNDEAILWVSCEKNTGIRFNVKERKLQRNTPILISAEEDLPVSYELEYDGMSSYVSRRMTSQLNPIQRSSFEHHTYSSSSRSRWCKKTTHLEQLSSLDHLVSVQHKETKQSQSTGGM